MHTSQNVEQILWCFLTKSFALEDKEICSLCPSGYRSINLALGPAGEKKREDVSIF